MILHPDLRPLRLLRPLLYIAITVLAARILLDDAAEEISLHVLSDRSFRYCVCLCTYFRFLGRGAWYGGIRARVSRFLSFGLATNNLLAIFLV